MDTLANATPDTRLTHVSLHPIAEQEVTACLQAMLAYLCNEEVMTTFRESKNKVTVQQRIERDIHTVAPAELPIRVKMGSDYIKIFFDMNNDTPPETSVHEMVEIANQLKTPSAQARKDAFMNTINSDTITRWNFLMRVFEEDFTDYFLDQCETEPHPSLKGAVFVRDEFLDALERFMEEEAVGLEKQSEEFGSRTRLNRELVDEAARRLAPPPEERHPAK